MDPKNPIDQAVANFSAGYLCSQSILLAYADRLGVEPGTAARVASPFGAGIAYLGRTCGAVTGALMVIGLRYGHETPEEVEAKEAMYAKAEVFLNRFEARHGSLECGDLLSCDVSVPEELEQAKAEGLFDDLCPRYVADAAAILGELLEEGETIIRGGRK
jgi:C_GCAxxG_C_C family probable redox protein